MTMSAYVRAGFAGRLLPFLQHLILRLVRRGLLMHFVVRVDLVNGLRLDSVEPADKTE